MKTLSVHDRPREKLLRLGAAGLGDNELVAIVVGSGSRRVNSLALANVHSRNNRRAARDAADLGR